MYITPFSGHSPHFPGEPPFPQRGNGGCVKVADWYHPHRNLLNEEQQRTLSQLMESATEQQAEVLREMLVEYGSPKYRQMYEEDRNVRNITRVSH